jgi:hypothetical protein
MHQTVVRLYFKDNLNKFKNDKNAAAVKEQFEFAKDHIKEKI